MLCEICNQNEANIHITHLVDGEPKSMHVCESCAKERGAMKVGIEIPIGMGSDGPELPFSLDDFFQSFVKNVLLGHSNPETEQTPPPKAEHHEGDGRVCPICETTIEEYLETGRAGCSRCYKHFRPVIIKILEDCMKTTLVPEGNRQKRELVNKLEEVMRLRGDLELSVAVEDYETASFLRDKIQSITDEI